MTPKPRRLAVALCLEFIRSSSWRLITSLAPLLLPTPLVAIAPSKVAITITPASASLLAGATQTFTATVSGTTNTGVTWSCSAGTITSAGLYTAPTTYGTYSVTATSQADSTKKATATVTVSAVAVTSIWVSPEWNAETGPPPNPVSTNPFGTLRFQSTVSFQGVGTGNVGWTCTGGSVSASTSASGVWITYTASATTGTYSITATSLDDPSKKASWGISVVNASTARIYKYISDKNLTNPGDAVSLTGWFSGSGTINHGVGGVTSGVAVTVKPTIFTGYTLAVKSGKTSATGDVYVSPGNGRGIYTATGSILGPRRDYATVTLPDGRVLLIGGSTLQTSGWYDLTGVDIYDPATGTYSLAGAMNTARTQCAAVLLTDGKVLIVGGMNNSSAAAWADVNFLGSWEVFDVSQGKTVRSGSMTATRANPSLSLMLDGRVLIAGGQYYGQYLWTRNTAEIFDPVAFTSTATAGNMSGGSYGPISTLLPSGKVLVSDSSSAPDVFDPASGLFAPLASSRTVNPALVIGQPFRLPNGKILSVSDSSDATGLYDETGNGTAISGDMVQGSKLGIVNLGNGKALGVAPNASNFGIPAYGEYDPAQAGLQSYLDIPSGLISGGLNTLQDRVAYLPTLGKALVIRGSGPSFMLDPQMDLYLDAASVPLKVGLTRQFRALGPQAGSVVWSVKEGASGGSITSGGLYSAPTAPGIYHVQATSASNPKVMATAEVLVIQTSEIISSAIINGFSAFPSTLSVGQSSTLTPLFTGGSGVIDNGVGSVTSGVPITITPTVSTTYTLTVTDPAGVPVSSKVTVYLPPVISNFKAAASVVPPGGGTTLTWSASGATTTTLKESTATGDTYVNLSTQSYPAYPSATTTYTLTVSNPAGGSTSSPVTVIVSPVVSIAVSPATASVVTGQQIQFGVSMTTVSGTDPSVTWSASGGTITSSGLYTSPATPGSYVVTATSVADPTRSAFATITVAYPPVTLTLSPLSVTVNILQQMRFGYSLQASTGASQAVTWAISEGGLGGTISTDGTYVAPSVPGSYHVVATSQANPTIFATAVVTVALPDVQVVVSPGTISLAQGQTYKFGYSSSNGPITWSTTGGTISDDGQYTAPLVVGTYQVLATSALNPSYRGAATVTVVLADTPGMSIDPGEHSLFPGGNLRFFAKVVGLSDASVTWSIAEAGGGVMAQDGTYTAPANPGVYTVLATSVQNTMLSASAKVTVGYVIVTPDEPLLVPVMTKQFGATLAAGTVGPVTWSVDEGPSGGSIQADSGLYTAPWSNGVFHVRATLPDGSSGSTAVQIGLIDDLVVGFPVQVNIGGTYRLSAKLSGSNGQSIGQQGEFFLSPGTAAPELKFASGDIVQSLGADGPWSVKDVVLEFMDPNSGEANPSDTKVTLGSTDPWQLRQFQQPWIRLNGQFKASGIGSSSSTQLLGIQADIGVDLLAPGAYTVTAALVDSSGVVVAYSGERTVNLPVGSSMVSFVFPGDSIRSSGKNGPYKVVGFTITGWTQEGFDSVGNVIGFNWDQF